MENKKKVIFITGASSGIGRETALKLAKSGHTVFAGVRKKIDKTELETLNSNIKGVYIDVVNSCSIDKAFWYILKNADKLDVLINNAGFALASPVECLNMKQLRIQFEVNTFGTLAVSQKFLPLLTGGRIINISSVASFGIFPYISAYCASKRAMDILMNTLMLENKDNIKTVSIKFASVKTPIWNKSIKKAEEYFGQLNETAAAKYQKEFEFMKQHALKSADKGLDAEKAAEIIIKAVNAKNPKPSYNAGFNTLLADLLSKLPQGLINKIVKLKLNY